MKNFIRIMIAGFIVAGFSFTYIYTLSAQGEDDAAGKITAKVLQSKEANKQEEQQTSGQEEEVYTSETISGEVSYIGKDYISIIYDRDYNTSSEYEMMIPYTKDTALKYKKNLNEIKKGDLISIEYSRPVPGSKGKSTATVVTFVQPAVADLVSK